MGQLRELTIRLRSLSELLMVLETSLILGFEFLFRYQIPILRLTGKINKQPVPIKWHELLKKNIQLFCQYFLTKNLIIRTLSNNYEALQYSESHKGRLIIYFSCNDPIIHLRAIIATIVFKVNRLFGYFFYNNPIISLRVSYNSTLSKANIFTNMFRYHYAIILNITVKCSSTCNSIIGTR